MQEEALRKWIAGMRRAFKLTIIPDLQSDYPRSQAVAAYALLGIIERNLNADEQAAMAVANAMAEAIDQAWAALQAEASGHSWEAFAGRFARLWPAAHRDARSASERITALAAVMEELVRATWNPEIGAGEDAVTTARAALRAAMRRQLDYERAIAYSH